jgi:hypothetical protein
MLVISSKRTGELTCIGRNSRHNERLLSLRGDYHALLFDPPEDRLRTFQSSGFENYCDWNEITSSPQGIEGQTRIFMLLFSPLLSGTK